MIRLLLVRHGQTEWNAQGRFMGQLDIPLDETGRAQVAALANRLKDEQVDMIYSSDLSRAWDTALAIQSSLASRPDPSRASGHRLRPEPRLRELDFGDWQGLTYAEIDERDSQTLASWESDPLHVSPPHGETVLEFSKRVSTFYQELCAQHKEQSVLLVAHSGALQLVITQALGISPDRYWQIYLSNASVSDLRVYDLGAILNLLNDTSHLKEIKE